TTGIWFAPRIVRIVRAATASVCTKDYVLAARVRGESTASILWNEVTPNITGTLLAEVALRLNYAIIFITTLNFLGVGVQPPAAAGPDHGAGRRVGEREDDGGLERDRVSPAWRQPAGRRGAAGRTVDPRPGAGRASTAVGLGDQLCGPGRRRRAQPRPPDR